MAVILEPLPVWMTGLVGAKAIRGGLRSPGSMERSSQPLSGDRVGKLWRRTNSKEVVDCGWGLRPGKLLSCDKTDISFISHLAESSNKLLINLQVSFYMSHQ